jgi:hypothetical protein
MNEKLSSGWLTKPAETTGPGYGRGMQTSSGTAIARPLTKANGSIDIFSSPALALLNKHLRDYERDLQLASKQVAKLCHSDVVSADHVKIATSQLLKPRSKKGELSIALGGILLGAAVGNLFSIVGSNGNITNSLFTATFLVGLVGACALLKGIYIEGEKSTMPVAPNTVATVAELALCPVGV